MSVTLTYAAEISILYNGINLFGFVHPPPLRSPGRMQKSSSTFSLSLHSCAVLKIALEKKPHTHTHTHTHTKRMDGKPVKRQSS